MFVKGAFGALSSSASRIAASLDGPEPFSSTRLRYSRSSWRPSRRRTVLPKRARSASSADGSAGAGSGGSLGNRFVSHAASRTASAVTAAPRPLARRRAFGARQRESGAKMRPFRRADDFNIPIVRLHVFPGDGQTKTRAFDARLVFGLTLLERFEDLLLLRLRDARPGVLDVQDGVLVALFERHPDTSAGRGVLDRVGEQIVYDYSKLIL